MALKLIAKCGTPNPNDAAPPLIARLGRRLRGPTECIIKYNEGKIGPVADRRDGKVDGEVDVVIGVRGCAGQWMS